MLKRGLYFYFVLFAKFYASEYDAFDDSVFFDVVWGDPKADYKDGKEEIIIHTENNEEYICQLPQLSVFQSDGYGDENLAAREIIAKLEDEKACSYRVDSYWIYEICHGRHVKQFHEERDVDNKKALVKQAYFLGYISYDSYPVPINSDLEQTPTINHAGALRPYYSVVYSGGTACDLIPGVSRQTTVFYLCMPDFQTSVVSVKEASTCKYEVIIYTSLLCKNNIYRVKEDPINHIYCLSKDGNKWKSPIGYNKLSNKKGKTLFDMHGSIPPKTFEEYLDLSHPKSVKNLEPPEPKRSQLTFPEKTFIQQFLSGEKCVIGGVGWWKYEFCYQKSVKQFHKERKGPKIELLLGIWDEKRHKDHVTEIGKTFDDSKIPTYTDLYFFLGSICDETGLPRQVKVRIRCSKNDSHNIQSLTMFMEEPKTCFYKFTAESVLFCKILENVDEYGIPKASVEDVIKNI